jgi:NAD(P)-dependent dehydrogenase (short-subunit alcohol dehydrogenase family)/catechol 2,3-dioxygenase-like lactoylglutathione lyase family enzyme
MPTAIITGASRGLGLALAHELAAAGWALIIDARGGEALAAAAAELRNQSHGAEIQALAGDITSPAHRAALIEAANGRLDLLINNAGTLGPSPLPAGADLDPAALRGIVETNVIAPHALTQAALPLLRTAHGVVVDVTSDAAIEAYPGWSGYGAAKAATEQLRNVLAAEETDVTVWRVDPGDLRTQMHQLAFPGEDISDRPLPDSIAPGILGLLDAAPASGRYRLADFVARRDGASAPAGGGGCPDARQRAGDIAVVALVGDAAGTDAAGTDAAGTDAAGSAAGARVVAHVDQVAIGAGPSAVAACAGPIAMWLTIEVEDFAPAAAFYRDVIGLPEIDRWSGDGDVGAVFAVGPAARVEIERPARPTPGARVAIEYADLDALTAAHSQISARLGAEAAVPLLRHYRGHSGFTVHDPRGTELYLWSEK